MFAGAALPARRHCLAGLRAGPGRPGSVRPSGLGLGAGSGEVRL